MATSDTEIGNMVLGHLGTGKAIGDIDSDTSTEAKILRRFRNESRRATLRDFPWGFATKLGALALKEEDPNSEWGFSYAMPAKCLAFRRILSGSRIETEDTRVPFRQIGDDSESLILTDQEDAEGEWTVDVTTPERYPPDFVIAWSYRWAALCAPALTNGDRQKRGDAALKSYYIEIARAQANAANEAQPDQAAEPEAIRARRA